jgi:DNA repair protein RecN (Recombination protein N)
MLVHLDIRNYALIDRLDLDLSGGFTVLTGETGAGKSIIIEALGLALGDRADAGVVRSGAERAEVAATLLLGSNEPARRWLSEQALDGDDTCLLRRIVGADGRSRAFINGSPVPLTSLRSLGALLIDIHGQHEHHSLLEREHQTDLLDGYAGHRALNERVAALYGAWRDLHRSIGEAEAMLGAGTGGQADLLRYQLAELADLQLAEDEWRTLEEEHRKITHAGRIVDACQTGIEALRDGEDSIVQRIARLMPLLRKGAEADRDLEGAMELIESARIQLDEAASDLSACLAGLDLDPERAARIEGRMAAINDLARKHHVRPEGLSAVAENLREKVAAFEGAEARLDQLRREILRVESEYREVAQALTASRGRAAHALGEEISREMRRLGMPDGSFSVELEPRADNQPAARGRERALFLVSTHPQQAPKPLAKIASGGELSRIGLAIQMITAEQSAIPCVVFDEVDVGIGGRVAEIVGQSLRRLGGRRQVLCITHLPQVAALGHQHLQITKSLHREGALVCVRSLSRQERKEELARMLGGIEISPKVRAHAEELIRKAEELAEP